MTVRQYRVGIDITCYKRMFLIGMISSLIFSAVVVALVVTHYMNIRYNNMVAQYEAQIEELNIAHEAQIQELNAKHEKEVQELEDEIFALEAEVNYLKEKSEQQTSTAEDDFNLLRKYWFVFRDAPDNSGLTTDVIRFSEEQCQKWDVNPQLMWTIYKLESGYNTGITNAGGSGAAGLGQVMPSTGRSMWERILGHGAGSFSTSMLHDPYVNIEINTALMGRNLAVGSLQNAIALYSSDQSGNYYNTVVSTAAKNGIKINESTARYQ